MLEPLFGKYRILRKLGEGGMGAVFLAEDPDYGRVVALKTPKLGDDETILKRFFREGRAATTIQHPHVCPAYEVGEVEGQPYLAMAYIDGYTLSKWVQKNPRMSVDGVLDIACKLASGLQAVHDAGILHRDLKPGNVMVSHDGEPHIIDFGMSRLTNVNESLLTVSGAVAGTPGYMSPEQVTGRSQQLGPHSDVYSLGVVVYELLTGWMPFTGSFVTVLASIVSDPPPSLRTHCPEIDPALDMICLKAMAKDPQDRFVTARDFGEALQRFREHGTCDIRPGEKLLTESPGPANPQKRAEPVSPWYRWKERIFGVDRESKSK
jgi:serine/threonine protein kinase